MSIGYACLTVGVPNTEMKRCIAKNATEMRLFELIESNLNALNRILDYNIANKIKLFRISSDLIPFGLSPINTLNWWQLFDSKFEALGDKIKVHKLRVSMHPGQYTVLNSPNKEVVKRAVLDLEYHNKVLDCLRTGPEHKIILHIGGVYNNKLEAIIRFKTNYQRLPKKVKSRLVIENDDKLYNIEEVLAIGRDLSIPVVFDYLHHKTNNSTIAKSVFEWIDDCKTTWGLRDGNQKIHYSEQDEAKKPGAHSSSIDIIKFMSFYYELCREDIDIMLEVKDKNLSAVRCIRGIY